MNMLRLLLPLSWTGLIAYLGSGQWGGDETSAWLWPILHALFPGASPELVQGAHVLIRKAAHIFEYAVLAILWRRAVGGTWSALGLSVLTASLDEFRQSFIPARVGSVYDVLLDGLGAAAGLLVTSALRARSWKAAS
jgi:VanZ family protein